MNREGKILWHCPSIVFLLLTIYSKELLELCRRVSKQQLTLFLLTDLLLVAKRKGEERFVVLDYCPRFDILNILTNTYNTHKQLSWYQLVCKPVITVLYFMKTGWNIYYIWIKTFLKIKILLTFVTFLFGVKFKMWKRITYVHIVQNYVHIHS